MEMKKVLRKATAIAASASFIGATMLGAIAQDLANYPAPFVSNGVFDAFIVVGTDAKPSDIVGAVDIGASLQFALKKATTVSAGAQEATIDQGVKIQKSGQKFNYGDTPSVVLDNTSLTADDLPTILADGKYSDQVGTNKNTADYSQKLLFVDGGANAILEFAQEDDLAPNAGDYLFIDRGNALYNYSLEFDSAVEYDNTTSTTAQDDLKTTTITMQGKVYTITDVNLASTKGGKVDKLTLLSGEAVVWLTQNNPITKSVAGVEHKVEVLDVTENADACQVKVDDTTAIIDVDETMTVNGVQIGVTDVRAIHAQLQDVDVCQISIGASELVLQNTKEVKVDDVDLDGSKVILDSAAKGELNGLEVTYDAADLDDDVYLAPGKAFTDPIFNSWKIVYGGLVADYSTYTYKTSGSDRADFKFKSNDGKAVTIPVYLNASDSVVHFGEGTDVDEQLIAEDNSGGAGMSGMRTYCKPGKATTTVTDCEGVQILASTSNGEAHVFEIQNIDFGSSKNTTDIKDLTYDRTFNDIEFVANTFDPLDVGSFGTLTLLITTNNVTVRNSINAKLETNTGGSLKFVEGAKDANITLFETGRSGPSDNDIADELIGSNFTLQAKPDAADKDIDLMATMDDPGTQRQGYSVDLKDESDFKVDVSPVGTKVTFDDENDNDITVEMPDAEVYGDIFVAPIVATVSTAGGPGTTFTLSKLNVGAAKLDSEISDVGAQNLIVVGGPCANKVAATVLNKAYPACGDASGIAQGTAMIQEVAQASGKVALVVAGWEADDTKRATRVLANYDQYALSGSSVVVKGTTMTDITVTKSA